MGRTKITNFAILFGLHVNLPLKLKRMKLSGKKNIDYQLKCQIRHEFFKILNSTFNLKER